MANPIVALRLDAETQDRLKKLGEKRDRSPHYLMKEAVEKYLSREEEIEAEKQILMERWQRYELTGETISHEDVLSHVETRILNVRNAKD